MATNIAKTSGVLSVTEGSGQPKYYFGAPAGKYIFVTDGLSLNLQIGDRSGIDQYTIAYADLQVNGQAPTSVENAKVLLNAVFQ